MGTIYIGAGSWSKKSTKAQLRLSRIAGNILSCNRQARTCVCKIFPFVDSLPACTLSHLRLTDLAILPGPTQEPNELASHFTLEALEQMLGYLFIVNVIAGLFATRLSLRTLFSEILRQIAASTFSQWPTFWEQSPSSICRCS